MTEANTDAGLSLGPWPDVLRRYRVSIGLSIAAGVALAGLIYAATPYRYTSEAVVALESRRVRVLPQDPVVAPQGQDPAVLRSEMDIITSRSMAERVLDRLGDTGPPADDASLRSSLAALVSRLSPEIGSFLAPSLATPKAQGDDDPRIDRMIGGLKVSNDGKSYTIYIAFTARDPEAAARVADAYAAEYLDERANIEASAARHASEWLAGKLDSLRQRLQTSEAAIQDYRRSIGVLANAGTTTQAQMLVALNEELAQARAATAGARARLSTSETMRESGSDMQTLSEMLASPVIQALRREEFETMRAIGELESRGAVKSEQLPALRTRLDQIHADIAREGDRIVASLRDEVRIAAGKEVEIGKALTEAERQSADAEAASVHLRELEREAAADRAIYESLLNRYKETAEQETLSAPDARLLSRPAVADRPQSPRALPLALLGLLGGGLLGFAQAGLRWHLDGRIRSFAEMEQICEAPVLGAMRRLSRVGGHRVATASTQAFLLLEATLRLYPATVQARVIAITSVSPGEGKTAVCVGLARAMATAGRKVLVLEPSRAEPALACAFGISGLEDSADLGAKQNLCHDPQSDVHFMANWPDALEFAETQRDGSIARLLARLRQSYDVVLIDTTALQGSADVLRVADISDAMLLVVRLGRLRRAEAREAVRRLTLCDVAVAGIVAVGSESVPTALAANLVAPAPAPIRQPVIARGQTVESIERRASAASQATVIAS